MLDYDKKFLVKSWDNLTFDGSSIRGFTAQRESDLRVVGEASSAAEALAVIGRAKPHIVLLDLKLSTSSDSEGLELCQQLTTQYPTVGVLVLRERGGLPAGTVLATKADRDLRSGDFSGEQTKRSIERSLRLLGVDRLDVVYLHDPEHATTTFEEFMAPGGAVERPRPLAPRRPARAAARSRGPRGGPSCR